MCVEFLKASGYVSALFAPVDTRYKQVDEPREAVLVHWLDVGQVRYAEEENLARVRGRTVPAADLWTMIRSRECQRSAKVYLPIVFRIGSILLLPKSTAASPCTSITRCATGNRGEYCCALNTVERVEMSLSPLVRPTTTNHLSWRLEISKQAATTFV